MIELTKPNRNMGIEHLQKLVKEQVLLLDNIPAQIWCLKDPLTYKTINKAHADFLGLKKEEVLKTNPYSKIYTPKEAQRCILVNQQVFEKKVSISTEECVKNSQGEHRVLFITKTPIINNEGKVEYIVCCAQDITERKKAEEEVRYMSYHDFLTGLYNRTYAYEKLERIGKENDQLPLSIILGDTNGLKLTNDVFGHNVGDELLIKISEVLIKTCRRRDIVSRIGGDEFLILLPKTTVIETKKIIREINKNCVKYKNEIIKPSVSFGYAVKTHRDQKIEGLLKLAEERMYQTKLTDSEKVKASIIKTVRETLNINNFDNNKRYDMLLNLSLKIAEKMELRKKNIDELKLLIQMHDIGKIAISKDILDKCGSSTEGDCSVIEKHSEIGYRIANNSPELISISEAILSHHENWDGTGYPRGIKGNNIPFISRIFMIVDFYVNLINSNRSYDEAIRIIKEEAGKKYDPDLVNVFIDVINKWNVNKHRKI